MFVSGTLKGQLKNNEESISPSPLYAAYAFDANKSKRTVDYSNPFAMRDWIQELDSLKFGSVTKDIEELILLRKHILMPSFKRFPSLGADLMETKPVINGVTTNHVRDIVMSDAGNAHDTNAPGTVVTIDSDDDQPTMARPFQPYRDVVLNKPEGQFSMKQFLVSFPNFLVTFSKDLV